MTNLKRKFDLTFFKFILVGIVNTIFGTTVMFVCYNAFHFSYWVSSAANYVLGSILSFFLNKHFTFENDEKDIKIVFRFVLNIVICYGIAYGAAKPLVKMLLDGMSQSIQDNCAMLCGMCFFVICNYCGQRFVVFGEKKQG